MKIGAMFVILVLGSVVFGNIVFADTQKTICVYEPMDLFMDKTLPSLVSTQIESHGLHTKTVRIVDQILGNNQDCSYVVKIERAINENYRYTDYSTKYQVSGNTVTIYAYKTPAVFNPVSGEVLKPMTNWSCEVLAHSSKYHVNYQISDQGYYQSRTGYCDPFKGSTSADKVGELPYNVIRTSVDAAIKSFGI